VGQNILLGFKTLSKCPACLKYLIAATEENIGDQNVKCDRCDVRYHKTCTGASDYEFICDKCKDIDFNMH
jgi:hypothetical protein